MQTDHDLFFLCCEEWQDVQLTIYMSLLSQVGGLRRPGILIGINCQDLINAINVTTTQLVHGCLSQFTMKNSYEKVCKYIIKWYFIRHRREHGKATAVELADMADSDSVDSKEKQDVDMSVENVCYEKIKRGSEKDAVVETVMVDKSIVDGKEQDMGTSVDNVCYDKLESK